MFDRKLQLLHSARHDPSRWGPYLETDNSDIERQKFLVQGIIEDCNIPTSVKLLSNEQTTDTHL